MKFYKKHNIEIKYEAAWGGGFPGKKFKGIFLEYGNSLSLDKSMGNTYTFIYQN